MADVFVSYARADKARVAPLVAAIEAKGWSVWWDPEITPGQEFDDEIDLELQAAKAVLVVWTPTSVASRWVRGEARDGAERGVLVPVRFEQARLPIDARAIHTTDLDAWQKNPADPAIEECLHALGAMIARARAAAAGEAARVASAVAEQHAPRYAICVLPFVNMSDDSEQEYFSDGITEDIITDLSKVSALGVVSRNDSFLYKGKQIEVIKVAQEARVTHVLEGSVRRAGGRLRITAQLIDGTTSQHVWAERYDRDASDVFSIQDEISHSIVKALKLRLLPEEKKAIERHGTTSAQAHNFYLMARQVFVTSQEMDEHTAQAIIRICKRAVEADHAYAEAWALMAAGYRQLRDAQGGQSNEGLAAVERALELDPKLAEAHAVKAQLLQLDSDLESAAAEVSIALDLDPESYEVNRSAARLNYQLQRFDDAIRFYTKAVALMEADINSVAMLVSCCSATGDTAGMRHAAEMTLTRAEAVLVRDQNNAAAIAYSVDALAALGEAERAKSRMERALLMDPGSFTMRYNFACMLSVRLEDHLAALDMLEPLFATISQSFLAYARADPDFAPLHDDARWQAMVAAAEARLAAEPSPAKPAGTQPA